MRLIDLIIGIQQKHPFGLIDWRLLFCYYLKLTQDANIERSDNISDLLVLEGRGLGH